MAYNVSLIFLGFLGCWCFVHDFMKDFLLDCKLISFWERRDHYQLKCSSISWMRSNVGFRVLLWVIRGAVVLRCWYVMMLVLFIRGQEWIVLYIYWGFSIFFFGFAIIFVLRISRSPLLFPLFSLGDFFSCSGSHSFLIYSFSGFFPFVMV